MRRPSACQACLKQPGTAAQESPFTSLLRREVSRAARFFGITPLDAVCSAGQPLAELGLSSSQLPAATASLRRRMATHGADHMAVKDGGVRSV